MGGYHRGDVGEGQRARVVRTFARLAVPTALHELIGWKLWHGLVTALGCCHWTWLAPSFDAETRKLAYVDTTTPRDVHYLARRGTGVLVYICSVLLLLYHRRLPRQWLPPSRKRSHCFRMHLDSQLFTSCSNGNSSSSFINSNSNSSLLRSPTSSIVYTPGKCTDLPPIAPVRLTSAQHQSHPDAVV
jgi:hypothetical protein